VLTVDERLLRPVVCVEMVLKVERELAMPTLLVKTPTTPGIPPKIPPAPSPGGFEAAGVGAAVGSSLPP
jgi:hypothetical protein